MEEEKKFPGLTPEGFFIGPHGWLYGYYGDESEIVIPQGVTWINPGVFSNNPTLEKVTIPGSVGFIGAEAFLGCYNLKEVILEEGVEHIGNRVFSMTSIKKIVIPGSVTHIGDEAFSQSELEKIVFKKGKGLSFGDYVFDLCYKLKSVELPAHLYFAGNNPFRQCLALETLKVDSHNEDYFAQGGCLIQNKGKILLSVGKDGFIPPSARIIGRDSFAYSSIKDLALPSWIRGIEEGAFPDCEELENVFIPRSVTKIKGNPFLGKSLPECIEVEEGNSAYYSDEGCLIEKKGKKLLSGTKKGVIPGGIESIGREAFSRCEAIEEIAIPEGVKEIGEGAFDLCFNSSSLTIPDSVKVIRPYAFASNVMLIDVELGKGVEKIGEHAFYQDGSLMDIAFPSSLKEIGQEAFSECVSLKEISFSEGVEKIAPYAFFACRNLLSLSLPPSLKKLGEGAFLSCAMVKKISLPPSLKKIEPLSFKRASALREIAIPEGVESIGSEAFSSCDNLKKARIASSCKAIGKEAFAYCPRLREFVMEEGVEKVSDGALKGCDELSTIHIPSSLTKITRDFSYLHNLSSLTVREGNPVYYAEKNCLMRK